MGGEWFLVGMEMLFVQDALVRRSTEFLDGQRRCVFKYVDQLMANPCEFIDCVNSRKLILTFTQVTFKSPWFFYYCY